MGNDDVPGFIRKSLLFAQRGAAAARHTALFATLLAASPAATLAQGTHAASFPVGMRQLEYIDANEGGRHLALTVFYPAVGSPAAPRFVMPFFANLNLYKDAEPAFDGAKRPRSIITAPTPTTRRLPISRTSSGSVRATSPSPSVFSSTTRSGAS